jgi:hypothetical protein
LKSEIETIDNKFGSTIELHYKNWQMILVIVMTLVMFIANKFNYNMQGIIIPWSLISMRASPSY